MILEVDWMWVHDPVTFIHKQGMIIVFRNGKKIVLKGADEGTETKFLYGKGLKRFITKATHRLVAHLFAINAKVEA